MKVKNHITKLVIISVIFVFIIIILVISYYRGKEIYHAKEKDNEMSNEASVSKLMSCYIYISPNANSVLKKNNINEIDILNHLSNEIRTRRIMTIDANRVFPGSKDSFYIGLKKKENILRLELCVDQGVSVHNMLIRWRNHKLIDIDTNISPTINIQSFYSNINEMLHDLMINYSNDAYKHGIYTMNTNFYEYDEKEYE